MDSKVRNLTIGLVVSIFALIIGMVFYENNKDKNHSPVVSENATGNSVNEISGNVGNTGNHYGDQLSEAELHAFMQDETFFDPDVTLPSYEIDPNAKPKLYLLASSVEKDIRVMIVGENGKCVEGYSFYVTIDDNQYKDLDQDGMIYIPDLSAGDYFVSLEPVSGYEVPQDPMHVTVKDQLEYSVINDITYMIVTEDEIDVAVEDTAVQDTTEEDKDDTENTGLIMNEGQLFGIDVSKWQKEINWEKVAASGVQFAIIRCGYRGASTGCLVEDSYFRQNIEGAQAAGIKVGVYFFTQAVNDVEAVEEASMVAALCGDYQLDFPVFIDVESTGGRGRADGLDVETRTQVVEAFCKTLKSTGYTAGVYSSRWWYYNMLHDERLQEFVVWDAEYRAEPIYTGDFKIWQYTSNGYIDGINTRVDLDISYVDFTRN